MEEYYLLTMPKGRGYWIKLTLTEEMRIALTKMAAQEDSSRDFIQALKALRLGLICYGVLDGRDLQAMYKRKIIDDDEAQFLIENGFIKEDFRPAKVEVLLQAQELDLLNKQFGAVTSSWDEKMKESAKIYWLKQARKYPDLPNARRLLRLEKEKEVKT